MIEQWAAGAQMFLHWSNILAIFVGISSGIIIGCLPGLTATMAVALLVPITFTMSPVTGIAMLLGVYKGGIYGGSISAILINTPGTPAAAATVLDGYPMAKQGKAEKALKMAIYASVMADSLSDLVLILVAPPLALMALKLGPPELAMLLVFALTIVGSVSGKSLVKGIAIAAVGLFFSIVGLDFMTGVSRFTFDSMELSKGLPLLPMLIGLFAFGEVLIQAEDKSEYIMTIEKLDSRVEREKRVLTFTEFKGCIRTILRSTAIGTGIGAIPGIGSAIAAFLSYGWAKRNAKRPEEFGSGSLEGLAAAEAGNNAVCGATLIPLLTLGIPGDTVTAVLLGAFLIQGLTPGPNLINKNADVIYGLFIAMLLANLVNLLVARVGIRFFAKVISVPKAILFPVILVFCAAGSYAINNSIFDLKIMIVFGVFGYLMRKFDFPPAPFLIAFVLGPMVESAVRQSFIISQGSALIFLQRPIALIFILLTIFSVTSLALRHRKDRKIKNRE